MSEVTCSVCGCHEIAITYVDVTPDGDITIDEQGSYSCPHCGEYIEIQVN